MPIRGVRHLVRFSILRRARACTLSKVWRIVLRRRRVRAIFRWTRALARSRCFAQRSCCLHREGCVVGVTACSRVREYCAGESSHWCLLLGSLDPGFVRKSLSRCTGPLGATPATGLRVGVAQARRALKSGGFGSPVRAGAVVSRAVRSVRVTAYCERPRAWLPRASGTPVGGTGGHDGGRYAGHVPAGFTVALPAFVARGAVGCAPALIRYR